MKQQQLTLIGKNIYEQFLNNKYKTKLKYLQKCIIFKYHFLKKKIKKYFHKWRLKTINLTTINTNNNKTIKNNDILYSSFDSSLSTSMNNFINKLDYYNDRKNKEIQKLYDLSEINIMNHCTFSPNISPRKSLDLSKKRRNNKEKIYIFLYNDYKNRIKNKEKKVYDKNIFSFSPKIYKNNKYYNDIKGNFYERYKQYINKKKEIETYTNNKIK